MTHEINIDEATFRHNMRGGRGYMTGNPFIDELGAFQKRPPEPKRVIGSWEADVYVEMRLQDDVSLAAEGGRYSVGQTAGSRRVLEKLGDLCREIIHQRYMVIDD